jgi:hypothetical protein
MEKVNDGIHRIKTLVSRHPLYLLTHYDRRNKDCGLFRGLILARVTVRVSPRTRRITLMRLSGVAAHLYGPLIRIRQPEKRKSSELQQIAAAAGRMIVYNAVRVRLQLLRDITLTHILF